MTDSELRAIFAKTDAALASLAAAQERTDAQLVQTDLQLKSLAVSQAQTDAQLKKVSEKLDAVAEMLGGVANGNGEVTEEFFYNSLKHDPQIADMHFDQVKARVVFKEDGVKKAELDILMLNVQSAAIIEVKHRPQIKDVQQLLRSLSYYRSTIAKDKLAKKYKIYGGIAGFSVSKNVVTAAKEHGLFVLKQAGLVISSQTQGMRGF